MAITVTCLRCRGDLDEPGGLLFSPPSSRLARHGDDLEWTVTKDHLCATCYAIVKAWIEAGAEQ